jgi:tetratricopeptide (TPR) repeat protein
LLQPVDAAACYDVAIALGPESPWGYYHRGVLRLEQQNYRQARGDFDEALRMQPKHGSALINRALAKHGLGQYQEAIADLSQAVAEGTPYTRVYFMRSRMRAKAGDLKGARQDHEEGLRRRPHDENDWIARGEARVATDPRGALADFQKALELNPRSRAALQDQASVLSENLGRANESVPVFDRLVELYPDYVLARAGRGVVLARLGQRDAALRDAKESLARDSKPQYLYQVAGIYALSSRDNPTDRCEALRLLASALRSGYGLDLIDKDTDLDPIRAQPEFLRLVEAARALRGRP